MHSKACEIIARALREEGEAILQLSQQLSGEFETAVDWMLNCKGRVITCGIGKSGHIARKTAGTLSSTGTVSLFLHAAEAVHGDLGMVTADDILLMYSHSGETDELIRLFPTLNAQNTRSILITGRPASSAGRMASLVLDTQVEHEACPNNLAPTTSTTAMLALSDALAIAVMELRGFGKEDFARFHPAGALGKRLLLTVRDVMRFGNDVALVSPDTTMPDVMRAITNAGAGSAMVVSDGQMIGYVSDGDLRRQMLKGGDLTQVVARDFMSSEVTTISPDLLAVDALETFQNHPVKIGEMPVISESGEVLGILMLKDLLRSEIL